MGLLNFIKPKKKKPTDIEQAFFRNIKDCELRFNKISKADFAKLPDNELLEAMLYWTLNKLSSENWEITKLPEPVQIAYSCYTVNNEVINGGLNQVYFNDTKHYVHLCLKGYEVVKSPELSQLIQKSLEIVSGNKGRYESLDDGTIESFVESYKEDPLEALTNEFIAVSDKIDLSLKITHYIRENISAFGY